MAKPYAGQVCMPTVLSDIPDYKSPIDGRVISGMAARREDLKRNNCIDARDFPSPTTGHFKSEKMAKRYGKRVGDPFK